MEISTINDLIELLQDQLGSHMHESKILNFPTKNHNHFEISQSNKIIASRTTTDFIDQETTKDVICNNSYSKPLIPSLKKYIKIYTTILSYAPRVEIDEWPITKTYNDISLVE